MAGYGTLLKDKVCDLMVAESKKTFPKMIDASNAVPDGSLSSGDISNGRAQHSNRMLGLSMKGDGGNERQGQGASGMPRN